MSRRAPIPLDLAGIDLVVFDKDGTLLDFDAMWGGWIEQLGTRLEAAARRPVAPDVYAALGYDPVARHAATGGLLAIGTNAEVFDRIAAVLRRWCPSVAAARRVLEEAWSMPDPVALAVPLADLPALFGRLRADGRRVAIATTDDRGPAEATLAALGIAHLVDAMACGDDGLPTKPAPDPLLAVCDRTGIDPGRAAVVGDTPADLRMARAGGAGLAIGVLSGVGTEADLAPLADMLVPSIAAL